MLHPRVGLASGVFPSVACPHVGLDCVVLPSIGFPSIGLASRVFLPIVFIRVAGTMGNVEYSTFWSQQMSSTRRRNYGKRRVFHVLESADELYEAPELWKMSGVPRFGVSR